MAKEKSPWPVAQTPLILRAHRLMEAFAKADDERDFYLDRIEGFILFVDLNKAGEELDALQKELDNNPDRYVLIPSLTFYEAKKIMESFVNEKVYDIDTKEKLLDIITSRGARENFLEFIYDHHSELEKWQQFYQERSRIRIIEWLRQHNFHFVFEEDLDMVENTMEKLKQTLFQARVPNDVSAARKILATKAKSYYSNEALNPRPKRGRPPKQQAKQEIEPQITIDLYTQVPTGARPFLFTPEIHSIADITFSSSFSTEEELLNQRRNQAISGAEEAMANLNKKLASLRSLSSSWLNGDEAPQGLTRKEEYTALKKTPTQKKKPILAAPKKALTPATKKAAPTTKKTTTTSSTATKKKAPAKKTAKATKTPKSTITATTTTKKRLRPLKRTKKSS